MPSIGKIRPSSVASAAVTGSGVSANEIIDVDADENEDEDEHGGIPFLATMPLPSPAVVTTIPPDAVKSEPSTGSISPSNVPNPVPQERSSSSSNNHHMTDQEIKEKERFLMFTRVLMNYLEIRDTKMHAAAKAQINECYEKNKSGDPQFKCLNTSLKARLRSTVGESYWEKARHHLDHFLEKKMRSGNVETIKDGNAKVPPEIIDRIQDDDRSHASNGTSGAVFISDLDRKPSGSSSQPRQEVDVVPHPSSSSGLSQRKQKSDNKKSKSKDIYLSLEHDKYKKVITKCWALLWGERNTIQEDYQTQNESPKGSSSRRWQKIFMKMKEDISGEDPSPKALAQEVYNAWKEKLTASGGGHFYRGSKGRNTFHKATAKEAVQKIWKDLQNGKFKYEESRFRKNKSLSGKKEPVASNYTRSLYWSEMSTSKENSTEKEPIVNSNNSTSLLLSKESSSSGNNFSGKKPVASKCVSAASPKGPIELPTPSNPDRDLVISLRDSKYHRIITIQAEQLLERRHDHTTAAVAFDLVKSVRNVGGKLFKIGPVEVDDEEARRKIKKDLQEKLVDARKKDDRVVIVNMKNDKYKNAVMEIIAKENNMSSIDSSWAEKIGVMLLGQFTSSGVERFFKNASDDTEIECTQVVEKIVKDVRVQSRYFGVPSARSPVAINDGIHEDTYISSTRKKRKSIGKSNIQSSKSYMTNFIADILPKHGWTVKSRIMKNGLEDWVASRKTSGATVECVGYEKILEEAFLSGFYEEHVVGTVEGKEFLENAGILDTPFSIFSEELKRRRKRRKNEEQTNDLLPRESESRELRTHDNADGPHGNSTSPTDKTLNADDTIDGECGLSVDSKTQSSDQNASVSDINFVCIDTKEDPELTATHSSPGVSTKHSDNIAIHSLGGIPPVLMDMSDKSMNGSSDGSSSHEKSLDKMSTAKLRTDGVTNENEDNKAISDSQKNKQAGSETMVTDNVASHQSAVASPAMGRKQLVRQLYRRIKTSISGRNGSAEKIETLRSKFYLHLKSWLAPRMKVVVESDLEKAESLMDEFESDLEHLKTAFNEEDEEDIIFYTDCCECTIEECKAEFPV